MVSIPVRHAVHRNLWRRVPRRWRRKALFLATGLLAPRPLQWTRPAEPIIVAGMLRAATGLGTSARLCHDALKASGLQVHGIDLTADMMQPCDRSDFSFVDGGALAGPGTIILHVNSPLVPLAMLRLGRRVTRDKYVVGYWAWELPDVPDDWRNGIRFVHEIWVPSRFSADAVRTVAATRPVRVVPHPVALDRRPMSSREATPGRPFTVLFIFNMASGFARKNPLASIAAFRAAFGDDPACRLIVKVSNGDEYPCGMRRIGESIGAASNIVLLSATMSVDDVDALYHESDVVISLHRSEGFGLTLAEGMARGLPVVATGWSGNADFVDVDNGLAIPYRLVPARDPQGTYHHPSMLWADADVGAAAAALRRLRREPELRRRLGEAGAAHAGRTWSAREYTESAKRHLGL